MHAYVGVCVRAHVCVLGCTLYLGIKVLCVCERVCVCVEMHSLPCGIRICLSRGFIQCILRKECTGKC